MSNKKVAWCISFLQQLYYSLIAPKISCATRRDDYTQTQISISNVKFSQEDNTLTNQLVSIATRTQTLLPTQCLFTELYRRPIWTTFPRPSNSTSLAYSRDIEHRWVIDFGLVVPNNESDHRIDLIGRCPLRAEHDGCAVVFHQDMKGCILPVAGSTVLCSSTILQQCG